MVAVVAAGKQRMRAMAFTNDGRQLALGNRANGDLRIVEVESGAIVRTIKGDKSRVSALAFSADDGMLARGCDDDTSTVFDLSTGKSIMRARSREGAGTGMIRGINRIAFVDDGKAVMALTLDGDLRVWPLDPIATAERMGVRELTDAEREYYEITKR